MFRRYDQELLLPPKNVCLIFVTKDSYFQQCGTDDFRILPMSPRQALAAHKRRYILVHDKHCLPSLWNILTTLGVKGFQEKRLVGIGYQPSSTYVFISSGKISRNSFES